MRGCVIFTVAMALVAVSATGRANASTITIQNTTDVVAYSSGANGGPTNYYNNGTSAVGSSAIGDNFETSSLSLTSTQLTSGSFALDLQYTTLFSGTETLGNSAIYYPDIFLRAPGAGYSNTAFNYAISLGMEGANGGQAAGLYSVGSYLTSQEVWSGRPGYTYGGQYTNSTAYQPGQPGYAGYDAPVVLTAGAKLAAAAVNTGQQANGSYTVDVKLTLTAMQAAAFGNGFDVFWGTGDCANGSFLASVASMTGVPTTPPPVPEPASLVLLATGLLGLAAARRTLAG